MLPTFFLFVVYIFVQVIINNCKGREKAKSHPNDHYDRIPKKKPIERTYKDS